MAIHKKSWQWMVLVLWMCMPWTAWAGSKITSIKLTQQINGTAITFTGYYEKPPRFFFLSHPDRFVADFTHTKLAININKVAKNTQIKQVRVGYPKPGLIRLVFDLQVPMKIKKTLKSDRSCTVDLQPVTKTALKTALLVNKVKSFLHKTPPKIQKSITVAIDPGHGGKDPGAIGKGGVKEKDVVLSIAQELASLINRKPYMHAILTRNGDYYVPLYERMQIARKHKADLYVAIHADSYFNKKASGVSIYALSEHGATSLAAKWLARRENHSELNNVALEQLDDQSYLLRSVLIDLAQTATVKDSLRLGNSLLTALENVTNLHYKRVEQAPFMVLKFPDIPSLLVETGFISNAKEERRLRDKAYQHKIALALFNGIHHYHKQFG